MKIGVVLPRICEMIFVTLGGFFNKVCFSDNQ